MYGVSRDRTMLGNNEEISISVTQAAIVHVCRDCVHVDGVPILHRWAACTAHCLQTMNEICGIIWNRGCLPAQLLRSDDAASSV